MLQQLPPTTRIWIYQAAEPFQTDQVQQIQEEVQQFAQAWISHNRQLRAGGAVLHDRFVVLAVDESMAGASGCSIDSSVGFIRALGAKYGRDLFDRMRFSFEDSSGQVQTVSKEEFSAMYASGAITDETLVFDTLVDRLELLQSTFRKPLQQSWHSRFVGSL